MINLLQVIFIRSGHTGEESRTQFSSRHLYCLMRPNVTRTNQKTLTTKRNGRKRPVKERMRTNRRAKKIPKTAMIGM